MGECRSRSAGLQSCRAGFLVAAAAAVLVMAQGLASAASDLSQQVDQTYQTNGRVRTLLTVGNTVYLGGEFTSLRPAGATGVPVPRNHLAAVDRGTGQLLPWNPNASAPVYTLAASPDGTTIYVGGNFTKVGGVKRSRLAALDATTGAVLPWAPTADLRVWGMAVSPDGGTIYAGGEFTMIDGQSRPNLVALDTTGAVESAFGATTDARVRVITPSPDGTQLYVGGDFASVNGDPAQHNLAVLDPITGAPLPWKVHPGYPIHGFAFSGGDVFAAGDGSGGHIGSFDMSGNRLWTQQTDGGVQAIAVIDGTVYGGGHFDNVCVGVTDGPTSGFHCPQTQAKREKLVAIDAVTGALDPWNPGANSPLGVFALSTSNGDLEAGGDFTIIGLGTAQQGYAQFSPAG
jgi:dipeptidyl aminopeptidase/acylaminoacyl peptidase